MYITNCSATKSMEGGAWKQVAEDPVTKWGPKKPPFPEEAGPYVDPANLESKIPAVDRYWSERLWTVEEIAKEDGEELSIISGLYGLLAFSEKICSYDQFLSVDKAQTLLSKVTSQLKEKNPSNVVYWYNDKEFAAIKDSYIWVVKEACNQLGISFEEKNISSKGTKTPPEKLHEHMQGLHTQNSYRSPLSQKEVTATVGDEEFSYDELAQPAATKPAVAPAPEVKKEEPKAEKPKSSEPKKEEEAKKGSHPSIDDLNKDWGKYWTPNTSDLTSAMGLSLKDGKAVCNTTVSFNGGDWAAQSVVEIALTRDANKLWVVINPQGLIDMMGSVADKYASAKESAHVFQPLRFLPRILELMAKRVSDTLEYKLKGMGLRGSDVLNFKMTDAAAFKEATDSAKSAVNAVATEHASKYQGAALKEKKPRKPSQQDLDAKLEKAFDDIPAADWEITEIKKHNLRTKTIFLPLKDSPAVAEALDSRAAVLGAAHRDMGKVGPYQFLMRAQNTLHVIDTSAYNYASWVGPKMERLSELLGDELSKSASATAASLTSRFSQKLSRVAELKIADCLACAMNEEAVEGLVAWLKAPGSKIEALPTAELLEMALTESVEDPLSAGIYTKEFSKHMKSHAAELDSRRKSL